MRKVSDECEKEISRARSVVMPVPAMPKKDFSPDTHRTIAILGHDFCDHAVAADGNDFLLLSEDLGSRIWSAATFEIATVWLQPVLIVARDQGVLTSDEYTTAINMIALGGHTYTSLDPNCFKHVRTITK